MKEKTVSLVLGAGGARGLAHIGVIEWLEQNGFEICSISGSSMGALIGGIYAAGELDTYRHWVSALQRIDVIRLLDLSFSSNGLIKGDRVIEALRELIGDRNIEDLPISYTAVATDIEDQKEVWLNRGSLFDAIRASIAIPTIFTPVEFRGGTLLDGGLLNPIPIAPTLSDKTDITIAVNLSAKPVPCCEPKKEESANEQENGSYSRRIALFVDKLQQMFDREEGQEMGFFDILSNTMDTMQNMIARFQLAAYTPDVIVDIPRNICTFYEFERAREMIEIGRQYAAREIGPVLQ
jgi:NTE family protein